MVMQKMAASEGITHRQGRAVLMGLWAMAGLFAVNGAWMLADPGGWFSATPGAEESGPLNIHFVRDVGLAFLSAATASMLAALRPHAAFYLMAVASVFICGHGLLHFAEGWLGLGNHRIHGAEAVATLGLAALCGGLSLWLRQRGGAR